MDQEQPFECCPSIGRFVSYTSVPARTKSVQSKSEDSVLEKLQRKFAPLAPFGEMLFKADKPSKNERDPEKFTVEEVSTKPYTQWLNDFQPGDPLPLIPPGFSAQLCDELNGRLVESKLKKLDRFRPMNSSEVAVNTQFGSKTLGPKIKDTVYSLLKLVANSRGLVVDANNKLRCPPGTPNANQFTDSAGSTCFIPVNTKPAGAVSSGARSVRRNAQAALVGAIKPGARDNDTNRVGKKESLERGRNMIQLAVGLDKDFKQGLFKLPSGQAITHFNRNLQGRTHFLMSVQELLPNVDQADAAKFWDELINENTPLTTLQKVQLEAYMNSYFQSFFTDAKQFPEKAKWITKLKVDTSIDDAWQVVLRGEAPKGKGVDPRMPISESGMEFSLTANPIAAYYLAAGVGMDKDWTAHGSMAGYNSQGMYTGAHEFGHVAHFAQAMNNIGFDVNNLKKSKNGGWMVDLRNIQNPNNDSRIAKLQAMAARIESYQSGQRYQTLASGQRVRVYAADVKSEVQEFYSELYQTITDDIGGTPGDFENLKQYIGADYAKTNLLETRAEAWAAVRLHGPGELSRFAKSQSDYELSEPSKFPNPRSQQEIESQTYQAMNNVFGTQTPNNWHARRNANNQSTLNNQQAISQPTRSSSTSGSISSGISSIFGGGSGLSGPMRSSRTINSQNRTRPSVPMQGLTGAMAYPKSSVRKNDDSLIGVVFDRDKVDQRIDTKFANVLYESGVVSDSIDLDSAIPEGSSLMQHHGDKILKKIGTSFVDSDGRRISAREKVNDLVRKYVLMERLIQDSPSDGMKANSVLSKLIEMRSDVKNRESQLQAKLLLNSIFPDGNEIYPGKTKAQREEKDRNLLFWLGQRRQNISKQIETLEDAISEDPRREKAEQTIKNNADTSMIPVIAAIADVTDKYPYLKDKFDINIVTRPGDPNNVVAKYATDKYEAGRILPEISFFDKVAGGVNTLSDFEEESPNPGDVNRYTFTVEGSRKAAATTHTYHEMGHLIDAVADLRAMGIDYGRSSKRIKNQLEDSGDELGDTVAGALFALQTGKSLTTKVKSLDERDEYALVKSITHVGTPAMDRLFDVPGGRMSESLFLVGVEPRGAGWQYRDAVYGDDGVSPTRHKNLEPLAKDGLAFSKIMTRTSEIISDAMGYDFDGGTFGENRRNFVSLASSTSNYAKTVPSESFAEGFSSSMMIELNDHRVLDKQQDTARLSQMRSLRDKMLREAPVSDSPVKFTQSQKAELEDLRLQAIRLISKRKSKGDSGSEVFDDFSIDKRAEPDFYQEFDVTAPDEPSTDGLVGAMSSPTEIQYEIAQKYNGFTTSSGSEYTYGPTGKVTRRKDPVTSTTIDDGVVETSFDNTAFVSADELNSLYLSFDRGVGVGSDGDLVGLSYNDRDIDKDAFKKLRAEKKTFDEAFTLAGGRITSRKIEASREPRVGMYPFEWGDNRFHAGSEITSVSTKPQKSSGLTGAMSPQKTRNEEAIQRVSNLEKALEHFNKTGDWAGSDFGVILAIGRPSDNSIDKDGVKPRNFSKQELDQEFLEKAKNSGLNTDAEINKYVEKSRSDFKKQIESKIEASKKWRDLTDYEAKAKEARIQQNAIDVEDIPEEELNKLKEESRQLTELARSQSEEDRKLHSMILGSEENSSWISHQGASELSGGVLDGGRTRGSGNANRAGSVGDTGALNEMQTQKLKSQIDSLKSNVVVLESFDKGLLIGDEFVVPDDATLRTLGDYSLLPDKRSEAYSKITAGGVGSRVNLRDLGINTDQLKQNAKQILTRERSSLDKKSKLYSNIEESGGFLSSYAASSSWASPNAGYSARYWHSVIPNNVATLHTDDEKERSGARDEVADQDMLLRWKGRRRGSTWLAKGTWGDDITMEMGPGEEVQLVKKTKPSFGISYRMDDVSTAAEIYPALVARAAYLDRQGMPITIEELLNNGRNIKNPETGVIEKMRLEIQEIVEEMRSRMTNPAQNG